MQVKNGKANRYVTDSETARKKCPGGTVYPIDFFTLFRYTLPAGRMRQSEMERKYENGRFDYKRKDLQGYPYGLGSCFSC